MAPVRNPPMIQERLLPSSPNWIQHGFQHVQRYTFATTFTRQQRVLDLACGVGYGSFILRAHGAAEVLGVDLEPEAIRYAREHYCLPRLEFAQDDAHTCRFGDRSFDVMTSFETIEHLPQPREFLRNAAQLLVPGGRLLVSAPNTLQYLRGTPPVENPFHINEPDYGTLRGWLDECFEIEEEWEQSPVIGDGGEAGRTATLHDLARQGIVRLGRSVETLLRRLAGRPLPPIMPAEPGSGAMIGSTAIIPLLPERRATCNVFLFVCRRKHDQPGS